MVLCALTLEYFGRYSILQSAVLEKKVNYATHWHTVWPTMFKSEPLLHNPNGLCSLFKGFREVGEIRTHRVWSEMPNCVRALVECLFWAKPSELIVAWNGSNLKKSKQGHVWYGYIYWRLFSTMQPCRVETCAIEPSQGNLLTLITLHSVPLPRCNWLCSSVTLKNKNFIDILTLRAVFTGLFYHIQPSLWKPYTHHNACKLPFFLLS